MVPNSLSNTGPYAGLWGHLKSIAHSLDRVQNGELADLDRERISGLIQILRSGLPSQDVDQQTAPNLIVLRDEDRPDYTSSLCLEDSLPQISTYTEWRKHKKLPRLIQTLEKVAAERELFVGIPDDEMKVLQAIVQYLLRDAEVAI